MINNNITPEVSRETVLLTIHNNGQENIKCIFWNIRGICDKCFEPDTQNVLFTMI